MSKSVKTFVFIFSCHLFILGFQVFGQEKVISSPPASIVIRNKVVEVSEYDMNTPIPFTILYPKFNSSKGRIINSDADKINIIGKLEKPDNTSHFYINGDETELSEGGMFFKIVELSVGSNILTITYVPDFGQKVIVKMVINYIPE